MTDGLQYRTSINARQLGDYNDFNQIEKALGPLLDPRNRDILNPIIRDSFKDVPLRTAMFDPTHYCPFRCPECIEGKAMKMSGRSEFSLEHAKEILRQLSLESVKGLGFYGGEPTSHPNFPEILEYALRQGFQDLRLITNGYYLSNNSVRDAIVDAKDVVECRVSLNAGKEETHTRLHHPPNSCFNEIVDGMTDLTLTGTRVGVSFLANEKNGREIFDSAYISRESGCSYFDIRPKTHLHGEGIIPLSTSTRSRILYEINRTRDILMDEGFKVNIPDWYINYLSTGESPPTDKSYDQCLVSLFRITISPPEPGSVSMCAYRRGFKGFTSNLQSSVPEWMKNERIETFKRIRPSRDCSNVICNRDEMNRALNTLVQEQEDFDVLPALRRYDFENPFML